MMMDKGQRHLVCANNAQAAVDGHAQVIVDADLAQDETDHRMHPTRDTFLKFYRGFDEELWAREFDEMAANDIRTVVVVSAGHLKPASGGVSGFGGLAWLAFCFPGLLLAGARGCLRY